MSIENIGLQKIVLDISKKLTQKTFYANEVDTNGRGLHAFLKDNNVTVDGTGVTLRFRYTSLNDGEPRIFDFAPLGDAVNGEFELHYPTEMVRGFGGKLFPCTIVASDANGEIAFENIFVYVNKAEVPTEGIEASNEFSSLGVALGKVDLLETTYAPRLGEVEASLAQIPLNGVEFGGIQANGNNNAILIERAMTGTDKFGHAIADDSTINSVNTGAYASFDADYKVQGATAYNHMTGFQARPTYEGSGSMSQAAGFTADFNHGGTGQVDDYIGMRIKNPVLLNTGIIDKVYGIFIDAITTGNTKLAIYSLMDALSYFKGPIQTDGTLQGINMYSDPAKLNTIVGSNKPAKSVGMYYNTLIGVDSGAGILADGNKNTLIGAGAGKEITTGTDNVIIGTNAGLQANGSKNVAVGTNCAYWNLGNGNVLIGHSAGKYTSGGGNQFIVSNDDQVDASGDLNKSLLYGHFDPTLVDQYLILNGKLTVTKDLVLKSPNGTKYALRVSDAGVLSVVAV